MTLSLSLSVSTLMIIGRRNVQIVNCNVLNLVEEWFLPQP
jgi:hypothetical protein